MTLTCLITGSSRGIGLAIAHHLAAKGHRVILNSRSPIAPEVLAQFDGYEQPVLQATGDISQFEVAKQLVDDLYDQGIQVDVLVNNAGITRDGLVMRMSEEDFNAVIQTNLNGCFNMCRHLTPRLLKQKGGRIINMTSVVGVMGNAGQVNYAASKAGMIGLTKSLAREVASRGITVNAIAPGFIETDMTDQLSDRVKEAMLGQIPLKRFGQVEHIAQTVDFLIDNDYITGQVIEVNGGLHI
ncbi:3-oxoacyl-[acyl-carrier-protein] reductase [Abiotrophia defectiva]|uniref:3-oxoacyl-[acyl-carrier-protein] reductase n=1 Tax=Abiotrophia defectiva ATCC 49176 TaxID=592010 RepID=W1Q392_ABIDE|nr:3-oxoacyl-[acyl-carrier-protein] reductase [Abiotrophia defectiva]ESK65645.1 3-oxoacyl-[acyl-carrier-protein] reductase [Abiotrophia defectiva ATCC 49176]QKH47385.1 3-oxoacyl-[acyl-carrier-protein] reductase [Abiotrophia defectiva]